MSITLPIVDLSAATVGTTNIVSWITQAGSIQSQATNDSPATLWIFNESPCGLQLTFQTGERPFLPAGGWVDITLQPNCTQYTYSVAYVMTGPLVTSLITVWFAPGETVPRIPLLGNSPIGGNVTSSPATQLLGTGQFYSLTTIDENAGPGLIPSSSGAVAVPLTLLVRNALGTPQIVVAFDSAANTANFGVDIDCDPGTVKAGEVQVSTGQMILDQIITAYNGVATAGMGVPYIVAAYGPTVITSTAQQTVIDYVPTANGLYRASMGIGLNNGTSGQNILAAVGYTAVTAGGTHRFGAIAAGGTAVLVFDGITSRVNGDYAVMPHTFYATTGGHIQVIYRDPANTPNDTVSAIIERLV